MTNNLIIYIMMGVIIIFAVHKFSNKKEGFDRKYYDKYNTYNDIIRFKEDKLPVLKKSSPYPVKGDDEYEHIDYLTNRISPKTEICMFPPKSTERFHHDFFSFRDKTHLNSSMRKDVVDNMNDMILDGNLEQARRLPNMKIQDIYNEAVKTPERFHDNCTRLVRFDNINPHGWQDDYGTPGTYITRDEWKYDNEKILNGGDITENMVGDDPYFDTNINLSVYE